MAEQLSNNASSTLNGGITSGASTLVVTSATGFPTTGDFRILIKAEGANTDEICTVTAVSGTTFTISRASEATAGVQTASAHGSGATVSHVLTAGALRNLSIPTGTIGARALASANQSCNNAVVLFDTEAYDTDGFHSTVSNTSRMTIPAGLSGKYVIVANGMDASGGIDFKIRKNGSDIPGAQHTAGSNTVVNLSAIVDLTASDYVELYAYTSGGTHTIYGSTTDGATASLSISKLDSGKVGSGVGARATHNTATTVTNVTYTKIILDTEDFDTDGFHSTASETQRMTIPTGLGGKYILIGNIGWTANGTGFRGVILYKNGVLHVQEWMAAVSGVQTHQSVNTILNLVAGDYIDLYGYQSSGGDLATVGGHFSIMRIDSNASGVLNSGAYNSGNGTDFSTTNTSFEDVTSATITLITGARRCLVNVAATTYNTGNNSNIFRLVIDGSSQAAGNGGNLWVRANAVELDASFSFITPVLSAGSHTIKLQMRVTAGTGYWFKGQSGNPEGHFSVQELPDSGALAGSVQSSLTYLGYNTIGASYESTSSDRIYAKSVTPSTEGILISIAAYVKGNNTNAASFGAAIYTDNSGSPGTLIAAVPWATNSGSRLLNLYISATARWLFVPINFPLTVGTTYWIAFYASDGGGGGNGAIQIAYDSSGSDKTTDTAYVRDAGPPTWSDAAARKFSIKGLFMPADVIE